MATPWCRLWADMPNDPKWRTIAKVSGQRISEVMAVYIHMMVCASNANERGRTQGWCDEDVANALELETVQVEKIRAAMQGRVLENDCLTGWDKRQPSREDGAAERAKAWRDKKKLEDTQKAERNRTQPNAEERPEVDTDTDNKTLSASVDAVQVEGGYIETKKKRKLTGKRLESFEAFWEAFSYKKGRAEAADSWLDIPQLTMALVGQIVEAAKREAAARPGQVSSGKTPKMAQGWLTARRWEDEPLDAGLPRAAAPTAQQYITDQDRENIRRARERVANE